jgi:biopolymer transport protein ExbD
MTQPTINVTPLIDVLLVLLIIFMVVAPLKPSSFKTRLPQEPTADSIVHPNPDTLVASVEKDGAIRLNTETGLGDVTDTSKLATRLREVFDQRVANNNISGSFADDAGRPFTDRIERSVFIKAPKGTEYGKVAGVIDAVKMAGAYPISLQIDGLDK